MGTLTPGAAHTTYPATGYPTASAPTASSPSAAYPTGLAAPATYPQTPLGPPPYAAGIPAGSAAPHAPVGTPLPMHANWQQTSAAGHPAGCQGSCCRTTPYGQPHLPPLESGYGYGYPAPPAAAYAGQQAYHWQAVPAAGYTAPPGYAVQTGATSPATRDGSHEPTALATDLPPSARNYPERQVLGYVKKRNWLQRLGDALWPF